MVKNTDSRTRLPEFKSQLYHVLAVHGVIIIAHKALETTVLKMEEALVPERLCGAETPPSPPNTLNCNCDVHILSPRDVGVVLQSYLGFLKSQNC